MTTMIRTSICLAVAVSAGATNLTNEQIETFLREARIVDTKKLSMGVTHSSKASMNDGVIEHDAHVQTIDEQKPRFESARGVEMNFRDSYKYNIAAYELAKMLDLNMVPPSVERRASGSTAAVTWWVDDVAMTELTRYQKKVSAPDSNDWNKQMNNVRVFDQLIYNTDRNLGNLVITNDWKIWMIDHTRAFRMMNTYPNTKLMRQIDRNLLQSLRNLNKADLTARLTKYLTRLEIEGILARRDQIVSFFDQQIAANGEPAIVFESPRR
jgi:hypothetical protein